MKFSLVLLSLLVAVAAQASTGKICFWAGGNEGEKGNRLFLKASANALVISGNNFSPGEYPNGRYPRVLPSVKGKDGRTYFEYNMGYEDGYNHALVDSDLLEEGTTGFLKLRGRGEGYFEAKYFCRDLND